MWGKAEQKNVGEGEGGGKIPSMILYRFLLILRGDLVTEVSLLSLMLGYSSNISTWLLSF